MRLNIKICLTFLTLLLLACQNQEDIKQPPQFAWESFQRFWGKKASAHVTLDGVQKVESGYLLDYGHQVLLYINIQEGVVTGVKAIADRQNKLGGQQFLRLVDHIMEVGSFRWSSENIASMKRFFSKMGIIRKEISHKTAHFIRQVEGDTLSFELIFIPNTKEMWSNVPLDAIIP